MISVLCEHLGFRNCLFYNILMSVVALYCPFFPERGIWLCRGRFVVLLVGSCSLLLGRKLVGFWVTNFVIRSGHQVHHKGKNQEEDPWDVTYLKVQMLHNFPCHKQGSALASCLLVAETLICTRQRNLCLCCLGLTLLCWAKLPELSAHTPLILNCTNTCKPAPFWKQVPVTGTSWTPKLFYIWKEYLKLRQYPNFAEVHLICSFASLPNVHFTAANIINIINIT